MIFRFDDVCINADVKLIHRMTDHLFEKFPSCKVLHGISPLVHDTGDERIFPKILNAYSDYRKFYEPKKAGLPEPHPKAIPCSHGLVHTDHRLMTKEAQELSILTSCSLVNSDIFIPPFNKWNKATEEICNEHQIHLIKFEDGWKCMEYNKFDESHKRWYLHAREFTYESFTEYLKW
jgi:hypothetical protein